MRINRFSDTGAAELNKKKKIPARETAWDLCLPAQISWTFGFVAHLRVHVLFLILEHFSFVKYFSLMQCRKLVTLQQ
jgi:hypothetical protein